MYAKQKQFRRNFFLKLASSLFSFQEKNAQNKPAESQTMF